MAQVKEGTAVSTQKLVAIYGVVKDRFSTKSESM